MVVQTCECSCNFVLSLGKSISGLSDPSILFADVALDFGVGFWDSGSWILVFRCTLPGILMVFFVVRFFVILSCLPVRRFLKKALTQAFATATVHIIFYFFQGYLKTLNDNDPPLRSGWLSEGHSHPISVSFS